MTTPDPKFKIGDNVCAKFGPWRNYCESRAETKYTDLSYLIPPSGLIIDLDKDRAGHYIVLTKHPTARSDGTISVCEEYLELDEDEEI